MNVRSTPTNLKACRLLLLWVVAGAAAVASPLATDRTLSRHLIELTDPSFRIMETDYFTIAYDTAYAELTPLIGRLEGIRKAVLRYCTGHNLPIRDTEHRLGVLFFDHYEPFMGFARENDVASHSVAGFYHHGTNVAAFVNTMNNPAMTNVTRRIEALEQQLSPGGATGPGSQPDGSARRALLRELTSLRVQRDTIAQRFNQFVIQHEAAHQVLFNLGVHVRGSHNPTWLVEGLACQFEVPQPDRRGRPTRVNHMRLADLRDALGVERSARSIDDAAYKKAVAEGRWISLRRFIADGDYFKESGENMVARYAQAWGVVHYLERHHREEVSRYLRVLMQRRPGVRVEAQQALDEFEQIFGAADDAFERRMINGLLILRLDHREAGRSD